jgi:hypothetical protein
MEKKFLENFKKNLDQFDKDKISGIKLNRTDFNKICKANLEYNIFNIEYKETEGGYYLNGINCEFSPLIQLGSFYIIAK